MSRRQMIATMLIIGMLCLIIYLSAFQKPVSTVKVEVSVPGGWTVLVRQQPGDKGFMFGYDIRIVNPEQHLDYRLAANTDVAYAILEKCGDTCIRIVMPNRSNVDYYEVPAIPFDLKFVFTPTDDPHDRTHFHDWVWQPGAPQNIRWFCETEMPKASPDAIPRLNFHGASQSASRATVPNIRRYAWTSIADQATSSQTSPVRSVRSASVGCSAPWHCTEARRVRQAGRRATIGLDAAAGRRLIRMVRTAS